VTTVIGKQAVYVTPSSLSTVFLSHWIF